MDKDANNSAPPGETPAGADPQGETPTPQGTGETPVTTTQPSIDDALKEIESLKQALKKTNAESAAHRLKAKELDDLKAQIEADKLSETDKLQKKLADLQRAHDDATRAHQERAVAYEVRLQASSIGIVDPEAAARLLDWSEIEYDAAGAPTNLDELLKKLLKAKPYLAGKPAAQQTSGGATNPARSTSSAAPALSWEYISKLTPKDWATLTPERKKEIHNWQLEHPFRF